MLFQGGYSHQKATKEEHEDKVSRSSPEGAFLQHPAVSVAEGRLLRKPAHKVSTLSTCLE